MARTLTALADRHVDPLGGGLLGVGGTGHGDGAAKIDDTRRAANIFLRTLGRADEDDDSVGHRHRFGIGVPTRVVVGRVDGDVAVGRRFSPG